MCSEDLNKGYFQRGNFAMEENASQIKLDLETDINIGSVE
jgi:hypothetical protein